MIIEGTKIDDGLICEGIPGDGCGGGRYFFVKNEILKAYDPQSQEITILLKGVKSAKKVTKEGCVVTVICEDKDIKFNLSTMSVD